MYNCINIRNLEKGDYDKDYFLLLNQLTPTYKPTYDDFILYLNEINNNYHNIYVIEENDTVIASITLIIELKFIHGLSKVAHIEDFVVHENFRGKNIGRTLLDYCFKESVNMDCYKIILDCCDDLKQYYEKNDFLHKNIQMARYL